MTTPRLTLQFIMQHSQRDIIAILKNNPDAVNEPLDEKKNTVLHVLSGRTVSIPVFEYILTRPNLVKNMLNANGETPLLRAIRFNNLDAAMLLVKHGSDISECIGKETPLEASIKMHSTEMLQFVISLKSTYEKDAWDRAVWICVESRKSKMLHILACHGARLDIVNKQTKQTCLEKAVELMDIDIIRILVLHNAPTTNPETGESVFLKALQSPNFSIRNSVPFLCNPIPPPPSENSKVDEAIVEDWKDCYQFHCTMNEN